MDEGKVTGGCQCGAVRYEVGERLSGGMICHCRMCQRAVGTAFSYNAIYVRDSLVLTRAEPRWFASSEIAKRSFCEACGSPLFMRYSAPEWSGWIAIAVASHDDPQAVPAERHFGIGTEMGWLNLHDGLPRTSYPDRFLEDVAVEQNAAYASLPKRTVRG